MLAPALTSCPYVCPGWVWGAEFPPPPRLQLSLLGWWESSSPARTRPRVGLPLHHPHLLPTASAETVQARSHFAGEGDAAPARSWCGEGVGGLWALCGESRQPGATVLPHGTGSTGDPSGGNPGLVVVRGACLQLQILPRRGGPRLLLCLDPSQRLRWSQAKSAAAARASAPWARLFPRVWTWICISKLEALGSGFSVNVWQLSALPWVRLIREPAPSCCRN